jgi:hypothetical protein
LQPAQARNVKGRDLDIIKRVNPVKSINSALDDPVCSCDIVLDVRTEAVECVGDELVELARA